MSMIEVLDVRNIIEIEKIRKLLVKHPDLMSMFEIVCIVANERLMNEAVLKKIETIADEEFIEVEPDLSDHSSDED